MDQGEGREDSKATRIHWITAKEMKRASFCHPKKEGM